jgi:hypothetical protein
LKSQVDEALASTGESSSRFRNHAFAVREALLLDSCLVHHGQMQIGQGRTFRQRDVLAAL